MKDAIGQDIKVGDNVVYSSVVYGESRRSLVLAEIREFGKHAGRTVATVGSDEWGDPIRKRLTSIAKVTI